MSRKWSFRRRLTALIASVFVLSALCLVTAQYFLVRWLLFDAVSLGVANGYPPEAAPDNSAMTAVMVATNDSVLRSLQLWSVVILVLFAGVAIVAANFLAGSSLSRVAQISATARQITGHSRKARLALEGPNDEIKELADTIDEMLDRLDRALTRQESFVAAASHELRTPLATARTSLEVPYTQGLFGPETRHFVERALSANAQSEQLLAGLLTLASQRAEGARPVSLASAKGAYAATVAECSPIACSREVKLNASELGGSEAPSPLLQIALTNLVKNAIVHGERGGEVSFEMLIFDDLIRFVVSNEGDVIPEAAVLEWTEPFNRGDSTRIRPAGAEKGLGLGLSVVAAVAEKMNATLSLQPRASGGVRAVFAFPLK